MNTVEITTNQKLASKTSAGRQMVPSKDTSSKMTSAPGFTHISCNCLAERLGTMVLARVAFLFCLFITLAVAPLPPFISPSPTPVPSFVPSPSTPSNIPLYPFPGSCVPVDEGTLYFCDTIEYDVFLPEGGNLWEIESEAYSTYLQSSLMIPESCCQLPFKDYVCATLLPRCEIIDGEATPLHPCSNWVCGSLLTDVLGNTQPCFICDSSVLEFGELCSCPNVNASFNNECLPANTYSCLNSPSSVLAPFFMGILFVSLSTFILSL